MGNLCMGGDETASTLHREQCVPSVPEAERASRQSRELFLKSIRDMDLWT